MGDISVASWWPMIYTSAQSHAMYVAQLCPGPFGELILEESRGFCNQGAPTSESELQLRQAQSMTLISKISSIAHAASMAHTHPNVATEILAATRDFCKRVPLAYNACNESIALTANISSICHRGWARVSGQG